MPAPMGSLRWRGWDITLDDRTQRWTATKGDRAVSSCYTGCLKGLIAAIEAEHPEAQEVHP